MIMFKRIKKWFARKRKPDATMATYQPKPTPPQGTCGQSDPTHLSNVTIADMMMSGRHDIPDTYESGHRNYQSHASIGVSNSMSSSDSGGGGGGCD